jgi:hypothetical protein
MEMERNDDSEVEAAQRNATQGDQLFIFKKKKKNEPNQATTGIRG